MVRKYELDTIGIQLPLRKLIVDAGPRRGWLHQILASEYAVIEERWDDGLEAVRSQNWRAQLILNCGSMAGIRAAIPSPTFPSRCGGSRLPGLSVTLLLRSAFTSRFQPRSQPSSTDKPLFQFLRSSCHNNASHVLSKRAPLSEVLDTSEHF